MTKHADSLTNSLMQAFAKVMQEQGGVSIYGAQYAACRSMAAGMCNLALETSKVPKKKAVRKRK